ncbi:MAG: TonB family protein [Calditrichaeota bacterium]|nr:TonB family protein [Calditrichota bacterium]
MFKNPQFDLKYQYRLTLQAGAVISLAIIIIMLMIFKKFETDVVVRGLEAPAIQVEDIPETRIVKKVEVPRKPTIPVEDPKIDPFEDIKIPEALFNINVAPPPPPPSIVGERVPIWIVEVEPKLIGGSEAIQAYIIKHNLYPKMAYKAGVSGKALIGFSIDKEGNTTNVVVLEERPVELGFGVAGVKVMKAMKFTPGIQRDKTVGVSRVQQLIKFELE